MICPYCLTKIDIYMEDKNEYRRIFYILCGYCGKKIGDVSEINWCDNMKCKHCGKKVFKRIWNDGVLTRMRLCVGCNTINLTGYPPNKGDKRSEAVKNKKKI